MIERPAVGPQSRQLAADAYRRLWARNDEITSVKAVARVRLSRGIFSRGAQQAMLIQRPESLRIDSLSLMGDLLYQLVHYNGVLKIYQPQDGTFRESDDAAKLLMEELRLDVELGHVIQLLSGGIPLEPKADYLGVQRKEGFVLRGMRSQVLLDTDSMLPKRFLAYTRQNSVYEVSFDDYREVAGILFPFQILLEVSRPKFSFLIEFDHVALNEILDGKLFRVSIPSYSFHRDNALP